MMFFKQEALCNSVPLCGCCSVIKKVWEKLLLFEHLGKEWVTAKRMRQEN